MYPLNPELVKHNVEACRPGSERTEVVVQLMDLLVNTAVMIGNLDGAVRADFAASAIYLNDALVSSMTAEGDNPLLLRFAKWINPQTHQLDRRPVEQPGL